VPDHVARLASYHNNGCSGSHNRPLDEDLRHQRFLAARAFSRASLSSCRPAWLRPRRASRRVSPLDPCQPAVTTCTVAGNLYCLYSSKHAEHAFTAVHSRCPDHRTLVAGLAPGCSHMCSDDPVMNVDDRHRCIMFKDQRGASNKLGKLAHRAHCYFTVAVLAILVPRIGGKIDADNRRATGCFDAR